MDIRFKLDTGKSNNYIPFHLYKRLFPKVDKMYIRQPKTCRLRLRHNEKEKICKYFVVHNGSSAMLGMQDIDRLGMLSIHHNSKNRQVAEESNKDKGKRPSQTKGNRHKTDAEKDKGESPSQIKGNRHKTDTETQNKQDFKDANPMVMGNNIKESILSLSELLFSQNLMAGAERKDDATTIHLQNNCNSIDPFSEVLNNQNLITGTETKEDKTATGMQFNYDSSDCLAESFIHNSCIIIEEKRIRMTW